MATHSSILMEKFHGQGYWLGGLLQKMLLQRVGHDWTTKHACTIKLIWGEPTSYDYHHKWFKLFDEVH